MTLTHTQEPDTMTEKIVHLAGPVTALQFTKDQTETRAIQRCLLCGELLLDKRVIIRKKRVKARFWAVGDWIVKDDTGSTTSILGPDNGMLPTNTCAHAVEPPKFPELSDDEFAQIVVKDDEEEEEEEDTGG